MTTDATTPVTVGLQQAGELCGVSHETIRRHVISGDIPARQVGRRWVIRYDLLMRWLGGEDFGGGGAPVDDRPRDPDDLPPPLSIPEPPADLPVDERQRRAQDLLDLELEGL